VLCFTLALRNHLTGLRVKVPQPNKWDLRVVTLFGMIDLPSKNGETFLNLHIYDTKLEMGQAAARYAANQINRAIAARGQANIILATGISQFEMLGTLVTLEVDWGRVTAFHLDEYVGLPISHPASFRRYLKERFVDKVSGLKAFHFVNGDPGVDPADECRRLGELIAPLAIDVACIGIGENGHLAFNDPPADFDTDTPFLVVTLDEVCRRQQVGEGWFGSLDEVPRRAISMSIRQIMKSAAILCTVPDLRKAENLQKAVEGPVTNRLPASVLQLHPRCEFYVDVPAASKLKRPG
jgi:glucosamine-6-phosphate deaminase